MKLPFEAMVAFRYLGSRRKAGLSLTSFLTVLAFATGVAALTVVTAVWNGFESAFLEKLLGVNAHGTLLRRYNVIRDADSLAERLHLQPGITRVMPFVYSEVIAQSGTGARGLAIKGIEPSIVKDTPLAGYISRDPKVVEAALKGLAPGPSDAFEPEPPGILVGKALLEALHVKLGDPLTLISPYGQTRRARTQVFKITGSFHSGMYEFDARMVFIDLREAQRFFQLHGSVTGLEVWTDDPMRSEAILWNAARHLNPEDPGEFSVRDWSVTNKPMFAAVRSQKALIAIVLFIMVIVAAFMINATLILLVLEKSREIAVLRALGARQRSILSIFVVDGMVIGLVGCLSGVLLGLVTCFGLAEYGLTLDPRVYYLERLPIVVNPKELLAVSLGAMLLSFLATLFPAWMASRQNPVDGLTRRAPTSRPAKSA